MFYCELISHTHTHTHTHTISGSLQSVPECSIVLPCVCPLLHCRLTKCHNVFLLPSHTHTHTHILFIKKKKKKKKKKMGGDIIIINSKSHNLFCFLDVTAWETAALHFHVVFHSRQLVFNTDIQRNSKSFTRPGPCVVKWSGTGPCGWAPYRIQCFALVTLGSSRFTLHIFSFSSIQSHLSLISQFLEFPTAVIHFPCKFVIHKTYDGHYSWLTHRQMYYVLSYGRVGVGRSSWK